MKTIRLIVLVMGIMVMGSPALPALAANDPAAAVQSFGVVDMNKIMQTTDAAKNIFSQMEEKRKEYQTQISKEEGALRAAEQEIIKQKDGLSKDEFEKKRKEFEEKVISGQKLVRDRKRILDQAFNGSMVSLRSEAIKIVAEVAKERNYSAVFTQDAVMISTPSLDMTGMVIELMNKSVKKILVDWSNSATEPGGSSAKGKKNK